ncbi:MAG: hypothetical protein R3191_05480 [Anaerolineales bacterium]|nr:hypothetical protein [Anaerolineales bacterium]
MTDDKVVKEARTTPPNAEPRPGSLSRVITWIVRLGLVVIIGAFLGAGLYFGVPALLQAAVEPVQENRARIEQLEEELGRRDRERRRERTEFSDQLAELQGRVTQLVERVGEVEARADSVDEDLGALEEQADELAALEEELDSLERDLEDLQGELTRIEAAQREPQEQLDRLTEQVLRLRALHMITQARSTMAAEEYVQAAGWIVRARDEIPVADGQDDSEDGLGQVLERLELALEALENERFAAADRDLQTAWETLMTEPVISPTLTPEMTPTEESGGADS